MNTYTHIVLGALLAIPLTEYVQCMHRDVNLPRGDDRTSASILAAQAMDTLEELGKRVFLDEISVPRRMSCATCLDPALLEIQQVCEHVASADYAPLFKLAWGEAIDCSEQLYGSTGLQAFEVNFRRIAVALSAWQASTRDLARAPEVDG